MVFSGYELRVTAFVFSNLELQTSNFPAFTESPMAGPPPAENFKPLTLSTRQQEHHSHSDRNTILNLFKYNGLFAVGHIAGDLNTAVDGTRVHHDYLFWKAVEDLFIETIKHGVLPQRWKIFDVLPFQLYAEHICNI